MELIIWKNCRLIGCRRWTNGMLRHSRGHDYQCYRRSRGQNRIPNNDRRRRTVRCIDRRVRFRRAHIIIVYTQMVRVYNIMK